MRGPDLVSNTQAWWIACSGFAMGAAIAGLLIGGSVEGRLSNQWELGWEAVSALGTCIAAAAVIAIWRTDRRGARHRDENRAKIQIHLFLPHLAALRQQVDSLDEHLFGGRSIADQWARMDGKYRDELREKSDAIRVNGIRLDAEHLGGLPQSVGDALVAALNSVEALRNVARDVPPNEYLGDDEVILQAMRVLRFAVIQTTRALSSAGQECESFVLERLGD